MMFVLFTRGTYSHLQLSLPPSACSVCVFSVGLNVTVYVHPFSLRGTSWSLYASLCAFSKPSSVVLHLISVSLPMHRFVEALVTDHELFKIKDHKINEDTLRTHDSFLNIFSRHIYFHNWKFLLVSWERYN